MKKQKKAWPWRTYRLFWDHDRVQDRLACDRLRTLLPDFEIFSSSLWDDGANASDFQVSVNADLEVGRVRVFHAPTGEAMAWPAPLDLAYLAEWIRAHAPEL